MERLKRSLSFRKKKDKVPECSKPHQWQEDERKVRDGTCSFQVRYLGCIEVFESRGMQVCEEAVKALKAQCKGKYQRAILYVSGDALRVVDEISKGLIVDQTIEKVSFCAPDRNHEKGFAYICRDGTTRRWICHGFLALKESKRGKASAGRHTSSTAWGERLSHAVGCAFAICLERKQKRDKESGVTVTYNDKGTSFTRTGSFRPTTITERIVDPQSAIVAEPVPLTDADTPYAVQRPHATQNMLLRQGSFRGFSKLNEASSPFKRQLSLRLNELPSTLERQRAVSDGFQPNGAVSPIPEASPTKENPDSIANMCAQLTQGLNALSVDEDPFSPPAGSQMHARHNNNTAFPFSQQPQVTRNRPAHHNATNAGLHTQTIPEPIQQTNPWANTAPPARAPAPGPVASQQSFSEADFWLQSTAHVIAGAPATPPPAAVAGPYASPASSAGPGPARPAYHPQATPPQIARSVMHPSPKMAAAHMTADPFASPITTKFPSTTAAGARAPALQHTRAHSIDASEFFAPPKKAPTLRELSQHKEIVQFQSQQNGTSSSSSPAPSSAWTSQPERGGVDPFEEAWAAKPSKNRTAAPSSVNNPFSSDKSVKAFEVQL